MLKTRTYQKLKEWNKSYPIPGFIIKLFLFFFIFDSFFTFLIGCTAPGGTYYLGFVDQHLDFVHWFEQFLLHGGGGFAGLLGYQYQITGKTLNLINGSGVILGYSCIGFSVMSFYAAFVLAFPNKISVKAKYLSLGLAGIILLNIIRIGGLAVIYTRLPNHKLSNIDHHLVFNITVYIFIFIIFIFLTRLRNRSKQETLEKYA